MHGSQASRTLAGTVCNFSARQGLTPVDILVLKGWNVFECNEKFLPPIQRSKHLMKRRASCLRPSHLWFSRNNGTGRELLSTILYQDDGGKEPRYQLCLNSHAIPIGLPGPLKQGHLGPFLPKASKMLGFGSIRLVTPCPADLWPVRCCLPCCLGMSGRLTKWQNHSTHDLNLTLNIGLHVSASSYGLSGSPCFLRLEPRIQRPSQEWKPMSK